MENKKVRKTQYFVETPHDFDAMKEYALQEGFMTKCRHDGKEVYHIVMTNNVDAVIESAVQEGYFEFYENKGICYRLTPKGLKRFPH